MIRLPEVMKLTGKSRSSIYLDISKEKFPKPYKIGDRSVAWKYSDINSWLEAISDLSKIGGSSNG